MDDGSEVGNLNRVVEQRLEYPQNSGHGAEGNDSTNDDKNAKCAVGNRRRTFGRGGRGILGEQGT